MMIQDANIVLYNENYDTIEIPLSPMQLEIVCKILGIKSADPGMISCYSDTTLKKMMQMKGNPLAVKSIKQEEK